VTVSDQASDRAQLARYLTQQNDIAAHAYGMVLTDGRVRIRNWSPGSILDTPRSKVRRPYS
jgi:hypothetical protein